jgi:hypothetical protein
MTQLRDWLKSVENPKAVGRRNNKWKPHTSPEGGARTLGYGHKLTDAEEAGNYVILPDGSIHDFDTDGGLSDEQVEALFEKDFTTKEALVAKQWDKNNKGAQFAALDDKYKNVLIDIGFQTGGLLNKKGKYSWPKLSKAIIADDIEAVKKESETTFLKEGVRVKDNRRNKLKKQLLEAPLVQQEVTSTPIPDVSTVEENVADTGSQVPSELTPEEQAFITDYVDNLKGTAQQGLDRAVVAESKPQEDALALASQQAEVKFSEKEEAFMNSILSQEFEGEAGMAERLAADEARELEDVRLDELF